MENVIIFLTMLPLTFIQDIIDKFNSLPPDLSIRILWLSGVVVLTLTFRRYLVSRRDPVNKNWK